MHGLTDEQELDIVNKISKHSAVKLKVDQSEIEGYLIQKLNNIRKNFRSELGNPYVKYLTINLRLYSLNFLRDKGTSVVIKGNSIKTWQKVTKWGSIKVAARRLGKSVEELTALKDLMCNARNSHLLSIDLLDSDIYTTYEDNPYVGFVRTIGGVEKVSLYAPDVLLAMFNQYKQ